MSNSLIIFGTGEIAELAYYYFKNDSSYTPVAFTVDSEYRKDDQFHGLPVYDFETIEEKCPPTKYSIFIALSYQNLNRLRRDKYLAAKDMGYSIASYVSSKATILNETPCGENCFILEDNTIQPYVTIGHNVTMWSGNHIGHHSKIHDHNFIASHVVISGGVNIGESCFIGVNATLKEQINIGKQSVIGAGALVLSNTPEEAVIRAGSSEISKVSSSRLKAI